MPKLFTINIITPDSSLYHGEVSSLVAPGEIGYLGILANHAPLITNLVPGKIVIKKEGNSPHIINSKAKGFLEVVKNNVTILLDSA